MCSELTPRARIPDTRIPQLMQPWWRLGPVFKHYVMMADLVTVMTITICNRAIFAAVLHIFAYICNYALFAVVLYSQAKKNFHHKFKRPPPLFWELLPLTFWLWSSSLSFFEEILSWNMWNELSFSPLCGPWWSTPIEKLIHWQRPVWSSSGCQFIT